MIALVDGDLIAYRVAASCQKQGVVTEDFSIAQARANNLLVNIFKEVDSLGNRNHIFLSGGENFRKKINPEYKANRNQERPHYLEPLREWLVVNWGATVTDGIEADDALAIAQTEAGHAKTIICSLDKDLRQVPGWHYSWEIQGTGSTGKQWVKEAEKVFVTNKGALFNFYWQLIMGDRADNVPGYDGKMRATVPKFLETARNELGELEIELDMFEYVYDMYDGKLGQMLLNGQCLYVLRKDDDNWLKNVQPIMVALGLQEDSTPS